MQIFRFLLTAREGNVFTGVYHSVHKRPHGYSVIAHPCNGSVGTHPTGMLSCFLVSFVGLLKNTSTIFQFSKMSTTSLHPDILSSENPRKITQSPKSQLGSSKMVSWSVFTLRKCYCSWNPDIIIGKKVKVSVRVSFFQFHRFLSNGWEKID